MPTSSVGNSERGVTLIEMVVALSIVGLIVAVSTPSVGAGMDSVRMATTSRSVASFLNAAVTHAERRQQPVELSITPKPAKLTAISNEPGYNRELALPDGIVIEEPAADVHIILMPGATVPGISIRFANQRGAKRIVRLDPMTGFPHVESVE